MPTMPRRLVALLVALLAAPLVTSQRTQYRPNDGAGNNLAHPGWGAANTEFIRYQVPNGYADTNSSLTGTNRPSARAISLALMLTNYPDKQRYLEKNTSDLLTYMGQFFDHDLDKIRDGDAADTAPIPIPKGDPFYDPQGSGDRTMRFGRSGYNKTSTSPYRETINIITAFVDGSLVYGSSKAICDVLRAHEGGRMEVIDDPLRGPMLPTVQSVNMPADYMANEAGRVPPNTLRAVGDVRGNVNAPIVALQTLWVREHNRLATELALAHPTWDDETLFQEARKWNMALMQRVCFYEYVPALGIRLPPYAGYNATTNPSIDTFFSTVSYRYGHSEVNDVILRIDDEGNEVPQGHLMLMQTYFNPNVSLFAGIEPILRGLTTHVQGMVEPRFASALQNYLFGLPGVNGTDLFARNIQRGRDHGIPGYNGCRKGMGLQTVATFDELTDDPAIAKALTDLYATPDNCDAYVCGLAERKLANSHFGPLFNASLTDQYLRTRDGDWYYFENKDNGAFADEDIALIKATNLRAIILRNTDIKVLPDDVWRVDATMPWPVAQCPANATDTSMAQTASLAGGRYTLGWKFVDVDGTEMAEFTLTAQGTGWVGLGIAAAPGSGMVDADIVMGRVLDDGTVKLDDMWATGFTPPQTDASLGCSSQVSLVSSSQAAGVTTITFRRPLASGDRCDRALVKDGRNNLIYAWHPTSDDVTQYHGSNRGLASVLLSSTADTAAQVDEVVSDSEYLTYRKHGILMAIAFCILLPLAALANRVKCAHFLREKPDHIKAFFYLHIFFNIAAVAVAAAGFALPFAQQRDTVYSEVADSHGSFGIAIMAVFFLQAIYPWLRPSPTPLTLLRRVWEIVHTTLGRSIIVMGLVNVALGIHIINSEFNGSVHFFGCLAAIPITSIVLIASIVDRFSSQSANAASAGTEYLQGGAQPAEDKDTKSVELH